MQTGGKENFAPNWNIHFGDIRWEFYRKAQATIWAIEKVEAVDAGRDGRSNR
jgi:hypothetical protein